LEEAEPVRTLTPKIAFKLYSNLKQGGTTMSLIDEFLRDRGSKNETLFLREMEKLGVVERGTAERTFENFPSDPCYGTAN